MSTVACLHHLDEPFLGLAEAPLRAAGLTLAEYDGALPDLDEVHGIISFGGGASAVDLDAQPALRAEADLLAEAVARDMPVLGLCLGGQVLARALGAPVRRSPRRTVAWHALGRLPGAEDDPLVRALPDVVPALHWNEDIFDLPAGAVELLGPRREGVEAFRAGRRAYGFQFHPEVDPAALERWYASYGAWLAQAGVDVLIVGAGLSGVGAACRLRERLPGKTFAILEARGAIGGTWDLFRFPGIRSDSDMFTLSYPFRPWSSPRAIVDGGSILDYVRSTAREHGVDEAIRFHHRVVAAEWSSDDARWTVHAERTDTGERVALTCGFLFTCTGYYRYDEGYTPEFAGVERFGGRIVHPQFWPEDLDYTGKRVVVIGSGATAVTLIPALAERAAHVTMLQRSPSYIISLPAVDQIAGLLARVLPPRVAYPLVRWKNALLALAIYRLCRRRPQLMRRLIRAGMRRQLPPGFDLDTHFNPRYAPWDQRMCIVPDGDLFKAISAGGVSVATDRIETFTERGIALASGAELEADVVVTATGLKMVPVGGVRLTVDGRDVALSDALVYRGMQLSDVPNMAFAFGYTNQSWTLGSDLTSEQVCRLLAHMDRHGYASVTPHRDPAVAGKPFAELTSGYILRSLADFPRQGSVDPWRREENFARNWRDLRRAPLDDPVLEYARASAPVAA